MNTQDRAVVKALLQYMTERHLTGSDQFRAALKHFNITTAHTGQMVSDESAKLFGHENNYFVDVFTPDTIDNHHNGLRATSSSKAKAEAYAADARATGDEPVNTRVLNARAYLATAHQLREEQEEVAAKEQLDEWANTHDSRKTPAQWIEIDHAEALEMNAMRNSMKGCKEMGEYLKREDAMNTETVDMAPARAVIARAIHVGANSSGHVIGEHEELVETLRNAGFTDAADKVDAIEFFGTNHKEIRSLWLEALRQVSATL